MSQACLDMLEARVRLLHLHINVANHTFIEIEPERDKNSPYYYQHLLDHLGALADLAPKDHLGANLVMNLKRLRSWGGFADHHFGLMSDLYSRRLADLPVEPHDYFRRSSEIAEFKEIGMLLRSTWRESHAT